MKGEGGVWLNGAWQSFKTGDVIFVPGDTEHTYENTGDSMLKFLCGIPVKRLRPEG